jgi:hypothetical protein
MPACTVEFLLIEHGKTPSLDCTTNEIKKMCLNGSSYKISKFTLYALFIYGVSNDALNSSDYIASNNRMFNK